MSYIEHTLPITDPELIDGEVNISVRFQNSDIKYEVQPLNLVVDGDTIREEESPTTNNKIAPTLIRSQRILQEDLSDYGVYAYLKNINSLTIETPSQIYINPNGSKYIVDTPAKRIYRIDLDNEFGIVYRNYYQFSNITGIQISGDYIYISEAEGYFKFDTSLNMLDKNVNVTPSNITTKYKYFNNINYINNYDFNLVNHVVDIDDIEFTLMPHIAAINIPYSDLVEYTYGKFIFDFDADTSETNLKCVLNIIDMNGQIWQSDYQMINTGDTVEFDLDMSSIYSQSIIGIRIIFEGDNDEYTISNIELKAIIEYRASESFIDVYDYIADSFLQTLPISNIIHLGADNNQLYVVDNNNILYQYDDNYELVWDWDKYEYSLDDTFTPKGITGDSNNYIYVCNPANKSILKLTGEFEYVDEFNAVNGTKTYSDFVLINGDSEYYYRGNILYFELYQNDILIYTYTFSLSGYNSIGFFYNHSGFPGEFIIYDSLDSSSTDITSLIDFGSPVTIRSYESDVSANEYIELDNPEYITHDSYDDLYITDTLNNQIMKLSNQGDFINLITGIDASSNMLNPKGICICKSMIKNSDSELLSNKYVARDDIFVVDYGNYKINHYKSDGTFIDNLEFSAGDWLPQGTQEVDISMNSYTASLDFTLTRIIESFDPVDIQLNSIAIDDSPNILESIKLFVTDNNLGRIIVIHPFLNDNSGNWFISDIYDYDELYNPTDVYYHNGELYACDNNSIITIINKLEYDTKIGKYGINDVVSERRFNIPLGVATTNTHIYVADTSGNRIQKINKNTNELDLNITDASINVPYDVAIDNTGSIYVANYGNNKILRYSSNGVFERELLSISKPTSLFIARNNQGILYIGYESGIMKFRLSDEVDTSYNVGEIRSITSWLSNANSLVTYEYINEFIRKVDISMNSYTPSLDISFNVDFEEDPIEYVAGIDTNGAIHIVGTYETSFNAQVDDPPIFYISNPQGIAMYPYDNDYMTIAMKVYVTDRNYIKVYGLDITKDNSWVFLEQFKIDDTLGGIIVDDDGYLYVTGLDEHCIHKVYGAEVFNKSDISLNEALSIENKDNNTLLKEGVLSMDISRYLTDENVIRIVQPYTNSKPCKVFVNTEYNTVE